jgi:hypothetical protein
MDLEAATRLRKEIAVAVTSGEGGIPPPCLAAIKGLVRACKYALDPKPRSLA